MASIVSRATNGRCSLAAFLLLGLAPASHATTLLYANFFDPETYSTHLTGFVSDDSPLTQEIRVADDFVLAASSVVDGISWVGYTPGFPDFDTQFRIHIYSSVLTADGSDMIPAEEPLHSWSSVQVVTQDTGYSNGSQILRYHAQLPFSIQLDAGVYWLSVQGDFTGDPGTPLGFVWSHGHSENSVHEAAFVNFQNGEGWGFGDIPGRNHHAFSIYGSEVPIPAAGWLLLSAIVGAATGFGSRRGHG